MKHYFELPLVCIEIFGALFQFSWVNCFHYSIYHSIIISYQHNLTINQSNNSMSKADYFICCVKVTEIYDNLFTLTSNITFFLQHWKDSIRGIPSVSQKTMMKCKLLCIVFFLTAISFTKFGWCLATLSGITMHSNSSLYLHKKKLQ